MENNENSISIKDTNVKEETEKKSGNKKIMVIGGALLGLIPLLFLVYLLVVPMISVLKDEMKSKEMYVIAKKIILRSDKNTNSYKLGSFSYGTQVSVYSTEKEWAEITVGEQKGYMSTEYLVDKKTFYEIEGVYGDKISRKYITSTRCKTAIVRYLNEKGYMSNVPEDLREEFYGENHNKSVWQIFSETRGSYNSFCFADFNGDFRGDAAFIFKNTDTEERRLVVFSFDKTHPNEKSKDIFEMELKDPWFFIRKAYKGSWRNLNESRKKKKIGIDGILIGSNRNRSFDDPIRLLLYNGKEFEIHDQK